ncbi:MAG: hypothetical protein WCI18_16705, partial [Pseudomonadota bacterium]
VTSISKTLASILPQLEFLRGLWYAQSLLTGRTFFSSGFRTILLRQGELGAKKPLFSFFTSN